MSKTTLREKFSRAEIEGALARSGGSVAKAAAELTALGRGTVSRQLLRWWDADLNDVSSKKDKVLASAVASMHTSRASAAASRRSERALAKLVAEQADIEAALWRTLSSLNERPATFFNNVDASQLIGPVTGIPMTVECLLSDLQVGKLVAGYDSKVARRRLRAYTLAILQDMGRKAAVGYSIERIVLALLGDIIESDKKHENSARATDISTAEQLHLAQLYLFEEVIEPLAKLGIRMDIVCVTGNHDHDGHGIYSFRPGINHLSYGLYKGLELLSSKLGHGHVSYIIPAGTFTVLDIYGQLALYEHGVGVAVSEQAMRAHKSKRSEQLANHLTYFRMGDKHTVTSFNSGQYVVNGAFFGTDNHGAEYSGILGFCSVPAQWVGYHVPRKDSRFTLYDTFVIQLDHVR